MIKSKRNFLAAIFGTAVILPLLKFPTPGNVYNHLKSRWTWYETKEILNALPLRKNDLALRSENSFAILSDVRHDLIRLNPVAERIWRLCDGRNTVDAMVRKLTQDYDISPNACVNDVIVALATFKRKGLISC